MKEWTLIRKNPGEHSLHASVEEIFLSKIWNLESKGQTDIFGFIEIFLKWDRWHKQEWSTGNRLEKISNVVHLQRIIIPNIQLLWVNWKQYSRKKKEKTITRQTEEGLQIDNKHM